MRYLIWCFVAIWTTSSVLADDDYIPLAVGNQWRISSTRESTVGPKTETVSYRRVEGTVEKDGKMYFRLRMWSDGPTKVEVTEFVRKDDQGYYATRDLDNKPPERELILPLKVGVSWERKSDVQSFDCHFVGLESVTVSGKTYENCFHVRESVPEEKYTKDSWWTPNVGEVKTVSSFPTSTTTRILIEFTPGK